jgi:hypothetical protein
MLLIELQKPKRKYIKTNADKLLLKLVWDEYLRGAGHLLSSIKDSPCLKKDMMN